MKQSAMQRFILTLSSPDRMGIVAAVAAFLLEQRCNIVESAQFGDPSRRWFFMRVSFDAPETTKLAQLHDAFGPIGANFSMQWALFDTAIKPRLLLMVSRFGHCLNDLLYRHRIGALPVEIPAIVSNHRDFYRLAAENGIPFHYLPVTAENKARQEDRLLEIFGDERCELVALARYMQILSPRLCEQLAGRAINIHHSFLPSFQGAKPYSQAHDRGVKLIGATAHYVTEDLDEGPIIEQDVARVSHSMSVEDCAGRRTRRRAGGLLPSGAVARRAPHPAERQSHHRLQLLGAPHVTTIPRESADERRQSRGDAAQFGDWGLRLPGGAHRVQQLAQRAARVARDGRALRPVASHGRDHDQGAGRAQALLVRDRQQLREFCAGQSQADGAYQLRRLRHR
jgi:formyltetrahydrofolate deformylase